MSQVALKSHSVAISQFTNGIFGKHRFGWWTWISSSNLIFSTDAELILATFQEIHYPVFNLWMDSLSVAANPPEEERVGEDEPWKPTA